MTPFCASCLTQADDADLKRESLDGRRPLLCRACREGSLRGGRWAFGERDRGLGRPAVDGRKVGGS